MENWTVGKKEKEIKGKERENRREVHNNEEEGFEKVFGLYIKGG